MCARRVAIRGRAKLPLNKKFSLYAHLMNNRLEFEIGDCPVPAVSGGALTEQVAKRQGASCLRTCRSSGSWTYLPRLSASDRATIHDSAEYFDHPYFKLRRGVTTAQPRRCRDLFARISTHLDVASPRGERLPDIGCDTGAFLNAAREQFGIIPVGVDVSERAVQAACAQRVEAEIALRYLLTGFAERQKTDPHAGLVDRPANASASGGPESA
jgi:hypothetical protein